MTDGELLLLALSVIYLADCLFWVRNQSVAFVAPWCGRWRVVLADFWIGNDRGSFAFVNPLPPLGRLFLSHLLPVSISPVGICPFNVQALFRLGRKPSTDPAITFGEIREVGADGNWLLINGERFSNCASKAQAKEISQLVNDLRTTSVDERRDVLMAHLRENFDVRAAEAVFVRAEALVKPIRSLCCALFLFLFVVSPAMVMWFGLLGMLLPMAGLAILLTLQVSLMTYFAHKALYPDALSARVENLLKMMLCPPAAIRSADLITRNALSRYSPIVLADVFKGESSRAFAQKYILDLQHPLAYSAPDATSTEIIEWAAKTQLKLCLEYLKHSDSLRAEDFLAAPQRRDDAVSYCPRCGEQFSAKVGACPDCPGVELASFAFVSESGAGGTA
ncbi:MAG TPA: hypothetical protein VGJ69_05810 [Pyrinomonadaceae bacterium]